MFPPEMPLLFEPSLQSDTQSMLDFLQKNNSIFSIEGGNSILNLTPKSIFDAWNRDLLPSESEPLRLENKQIQRDVLNTITSLPDSWYDWLIAYPPINTTFETNDIATDNAISFENKVNDKRLLELEQNFSKQFISHILEDDFEYGIESQAHTIVKEQMKINAVVTKEWLNRIYVTNFHNSEILIGILRVIARFEKEEIFPIGHTIAVASLNHKDEIVQETAIRAFESWGGKASLKILENVSVSSKWVKEYIEEVIADLKTEYVD
ncbi:MAG: hypothetical protein MdMp024_1837 [Bacteroidales bacterium]